MYERTGNLITGKFNEYLVPTIMTSLAMSLASVVDSIIVGNLIGDTALAAVGMSTPIIYILNMIYLMFATGGVACSAIARGQRNTRAANNIFALTIFVGLIAMFALVAIVLVFLEPISYALAGGIDSMAESVSQYLSSLIISGPALMFASGISLFWRMDGNPKMSAVVVLVANIVNLILDFILIKYLNAGIFGAGISTALGYVVGSFVVLAYVFSKKRTFKFILPKRKELKLLSDIVRTGTPKALLQATNFFCTLILNALITATLGVLGMSVMAICTNILMIANIFGGGASDAMLPIIGGLYGEKDYFGVKRTIKNVGKVVLIGSICLVAFFMLLPHVVGFWFGLEPPTEIQFAIPAIRMYSLYLPLYIVNIVMQNFYTVTGRRKLASALAVMDRFIFVVIFALAIVALGIGDLLWLSYAFSGASTLLILLAFCKWIRKKEGVLGVLLLREEKQVGVVYDISIKATPEQATGISTEVISFCQQNNVDKITTNHLGVAIEEMAISIANYGYHNKKEGDIDILLRITENFLVVRFRDDGDIFDPTSYVADNAPRSNNGENVLTDSVEVIKKLANEINYERQLGFNTTVLTFDR